jgi:putative transposase
MFQDEAGFGRINKPKRCWCSKKARPSVPCHHIREYRYAYGAVEPVTGEHFFLVLPRCDTICMNVFLNELSKAALFKIFCKRANRDVQMISGAGGRACG